MKFSIKDFFCKCDPNPQLPADLVTFTEEAFHGNLQFLWGGTVMQIEKALINDCFRVSRLSCKFCTPTISNFTVNYP